MAQRSPNYYQLLDLQVYEHSANLTGAEVRAAYRKALLKYHPDKQDKPAITPGTNGPSSVTVDDIALAYKTLSDSQLRAEYDRWLWDVQSAEGGGKPLRTGLETVDLDDLVYNDKANVWTRNCRCGEEKGFLVLETDLEQNVDDGEVIVGCKGCSLWLRVLFSVDG